MKEHEENSIYMPIVLIRSEVAKQLGEPFIQDITSKSTVCILNEKLFNIPEEFKSPSNAFERLKERFEDLCEFEGIQFDNESNIIQVDTKIENLFIGKKAKFLISEIGFQLYDEFEYSLDNLYLAPDFEEAKQGIKFMVDNYKEVYCDPLPEDKKIVYQQIREEIKEFIKQNYNDVIILN